MKSISVGKDVVVTSCKPKKVKEHLRYHNTDGWIRIGGGVQDDGRLFFIWQKQ